MQRWIALVLLAGAWSASCAHDGAAATARTPRAARATTVVAPATTAATADWLPGCGARFAAAMPALSRLGHALLYVGGDDGGARAPRSVAVEIDVDGVSNQLSAAVVEDPTPDLHDGAPRRVPRIWGRWHDADADAEEPSSAYVPRVWDLVYEHLHRRTAAGATHGMIAGRRPVPQATVGAFVALARPLVEACVADAARP